MSLQRTIEKRVSLSGIGLHSGVPTRVTITPAPADVGIAFQAPGRTAAVPAVVGAVVDSANATTLGVNGTRIRMIEHLMAAFAGLGIDNAYVEVQGGEVPAVDGSSAPFVSLLRSAGRVILGARRRPLTIDRPLRVGDDRRWLQVLPSNTFRITYTLENPHRA